MEAGIHHTYREFVATRTYSVKFKHAQLGETVRETTQGSEEAARQWFEQEYGTRNGHELISIHSTNAATKGRLMAIDSCVGKRGVLVRGYAVQIASTKATGSNKRYRLFCPEGHSQLAMDRFDRGYTWTKEAGGTDFYCKTCTKIYRESRP